MINRSRVKMLAQRAESLAAATKTATPQEELEWVVMESHDVARRTCLVLQQVLPPADNPVDLREAAAVFQEWHRRLEVAGLRAELSRSMRDLKAVARRERRFAKSRMRTRGHLSAERVENLEALGHAIGWMTLHFKMLHKVKKFPKPA